MNREVEHTTGNHFHIERRSDGVAVIRIDSPGQSQNTLGAEAINEASHLLDALDADHAVRGVVFASGKPGSFIAGADIRMIADCESAEEVEALSHTGQRIFERIENFRVPVVAAIDGLCLGGGLELALACRRRVCTDAPGTRLGLPEVQLGLLPGSGGTQRLPRLIGLAASLDLMLTGRQVNGRRARKSGLVDDCVPPSILLDVAIDLALRPGDDAPRGGGVKRWLMDGNPLGRRVVLDQARRNVERRTHGNYPAPGRIIDCVETGAREGMEAGLRAEARAFGELAMTPESAELRGIYFATTAMKKDTGVDDPAVVPRPVERVAVLGAGLMGAGIACATSDRAGLPVRLKDVRAEGLSKGLAHVAKVIEGRRRRGSLSRFEAARARHRVTPTLDYSGFAGVDLVLEAVFEDLDMKHRMVREIESATGERTVFASNTSSIPIGRIAEGAARPENVVGMHYFSPVEKMPLLEVIAHEGTAPEVVATAVAVGRRQGKTPIVVRDGAGFYVNRILAPYLNEAVRMLEDGVPIDDIDGALVRFGFPVGPFKLLDEVGIDIVAHVAPILHEAFGERMEPVGATDRMITDERLGRKSGRGFYRYGGRKSGKVVDETLYDLLGVQPNRPIEPAEIVDRTVLPMINEAVRCLDEGILRTARDGDIGAVYGIGFPPFRGGPFRYLDARGTRTVATRLTELADRHGERFAPASHLADIARADGRIHDG